MTTLEMTMTSQPGRILALLELADEAPTIEELAEFLTDDDPDVRRTALGVLSEATEEWAPAAPVIAAALTDPADTVRRTAIDLLRELREVLAPSGKFAAALRAALRHPDEVVRAAAVGALWRHRLCTVEDLTALQFDAGESVRREVVLGLVSMDALTALDAAAKDSAAAIRMEVARGLAVVSDPGGVPTLIALAQDSEVGVRAAAFSAMAHTGCAGEATILARAALTDPAWQVRQGAATALAAADPAEAINPLITATGDANLDVRKAAVRALAAWVPGHPEVRAALETARSDADVRAPGPCRFHRSRPLKEHLMALVTSRADVPVTIDEVTCIDGCRLCVDMCPLDSLAINPDSGKAYMHVDECWYCGPCAARWPRLGSAPGRTTRSPGRTSRPGRR